MSVYYPGGPTKPIIQITWLGTEPKLPSILLNSHMDVVPAVAENWIYPPFSARIDDEGQIFARGTQDIKCIGMQYLAAIRKLRSDGIKLRRTIHVLFVPGKKKSTPKEIFLWSVLSRIFKSNPKFNLIQLINSGRFIHAPKISIKSP